MADKKPARKPAAPGIEQVVVEAILRGIGQLFAALFRVIFNRGATGGKKGGVYQAQVQELKEHWENVELHLLQDATRSLAVSEADKLLDAAMQLKGFKGETMGERLKQGEAYFPSNLYQQIWEAHKLRNTLAHELGASVTAEQARQAVATFRSALYHLQILT